MKKTFNRILCISLVLLMCMNIILPILPNIPFPDFSKAAQAEANAPSAATVLQEQPLGEELSSGEWRYALRATDGYAVITGYDGSSQHPVVPAVLDGADVVGLAEGAFITSPSAVTLHGNILFISDHAFSDKRTEIHALNGSYALLWASEHGHSFINASEGTFYPDVIDFTDADTDRVRRRGDSYVELGQLEAKRVSVGTILWMKDARGNVYLYRILSLMPQGGKVIATVEIPHFGEAIKNMSLTQTINTSTADLVPAEGVVFNNSLSAAPKAVTTTTEPTKGMSLDISGKLQEEMSKSASKKYAQISASMVTNGYVTYTVKVVDGELLDIQLAESNTQEITVNIKTAASYKESLYDSDKKTDDASFHVGDIPISTPFFSANLGIDVGIEFSGSVEVSFKQTTITEKEYDFDAEEWVILDKYGSNDTDEDGFSYTGTLEAKIFISAEFEVSAFWVVKILKIEVEGGVKLTVSKSSDSMCLKIALSPYLEMTGSIGLGLGLAGEGEIGAYKNFMDSDLLPDTLSALEFHCSPNDPYIHKASNCPFGESCKLTLYDRLKPNALYMTVVKDSPVYAMYKPSPTEKSGDFLGWCTTIDGAVPDFEYGLTFGPDIDFSLDSGVEVTAVKTGTPVTQDMALYALWENSAVVTFDTQCESYVPAQLIPLGGYVTKPEAPERENYRFMGWYADSDLLTSWNFTGNTVEQEQITLYAKWKPLPGYVAEHESVFLGDPDATAFPTQKTEEYFTYRIVSEAGYDSVCLTGLTSLATDVCIPVSLEIDGEEYNVSEVANGMFRDNTNITSVKFQYVGAECDFSNMFSGCTNLKYVDMHTIGFTDPKTIPSGLFNGCSSLQAVVLPGGFTDIGSNAFSGCTSLPVLELPSNVTNIGNSAFRNCSGITELTLPDSLVSIGTQAFAGCTGLSELYIPDSVTTIKLMPGLNIATGPFYGCTNIQTISVGGVSELSQCMLETKSTVLREITIRGSVKTIGENCFYSDYLKDLDTEGRSVRVVIEPGVETIEANAFRACASLTEVVLPSTIITIGSAAFSGCSQLKALTGFDSCRISTINSGLFYGCSGLDEITIPQTVTFIGKNAFGNCTGLTELYIPDSVTSIELAPGTSIATGPFYGCTNIQTISVGGVSELTQCMLETKSTVLREITIRGSVKNIGANCFHSAYLKDLSTSGRSVRVVIEPGVETIGENAFRDCISLTEITLPSTITTIGPAAFSGCSQLVSLTGFDSCKIPKINSGLFYGCSGLEEITIPQTVTFIGKNAFGNCTGLTELYIPDSVTSIELAPGTSITTGPFYGCTNIQTISVGGVSELTQCMLETKSTVLREITIRGSVKNIGANCFHSAYLKDLSTLGRSVRVVIEPGVETIGENAFRDCISLSEIALPSTITTIGPAAFSGCSQLVSLTGFDSCKIPKINSGLFYGCSGLDEITIPQTVTFIGKSAFGNCSGLTELYIPDSVTSIELAPGGSIATGPFYGCTNIQTISVGGVSELTQCMLETKSTVLREITIRGSVKTIGENCFSSYYLKDLDTDGRTVRVVIEPGVETIGENAFRDCISLNELILPSTITTIGSFAFSGCNQLVSITGFDSCKISKISSGLFYGCSGLNEITFPKTVTSIGTNAFTNCTGLTELFIPDNVTSIELAPGGSIATGPFYGCTNIQKINVGGVSELSQCMLETKSTVLEEITIRGSVKSIGKDCFFSTYLKDLSTSGRNVRVVIEPGVETIGENAFRGCISLTELVLPSTVISIGSSAFNGCTKLNALMIPSGASGFSSSSFKANANRTVYLTGENEEAYDYFTSLGDTIVMDGAFPANTLLLNANGGAFASALTAEDESTRSFQLVWMDEIPELPVPENGDKLFSGWFTDVACTKPFNATAMTAGDLILYAGWDIDMYTINLNLMGGTLDHELSFKVKAGSAFLQELVPQLEDHAFDGWYTDEACTIPFTATTMPANDLTLYAGWKLNTYMVTLNLMGGTLDHALSFKAQTGTKPVAQLVPQMNDRAFCGWYMDRYATTPFNGVMPDRDVTLYASYVKSGLNGQYIFAGGEATLVSYHMVESESAVLYLPETVNGMPVTGIAANAFDDEPVETLWLPANLTNLDSRAFENMPELKRIEVRPGNHHFASVNGVLYSADLTKVIRYPAKAGFVYDLPERVTAIGAYAFAETPLMQLNANHSLETIEDHAFTNTSLSRLTLPSSLKVMGDYAFSDCRKLVIVSFEGDVDQFGTGCFQGGSALLALYGPVKTADGQTPHLNEYCQANNILYNYYALEMVSDKTRTRLTQAGAPLELPTNTALPENMYFAGWFTASDSTGEPVAADSVMPARNWTVYAHSLPVFTYEIITQDDGTQSIMLTGWDPGCGQTAVVVPEQLNNLPVTAIGSNCFTSAPESISVPATVTVLNDGWLPDDWNGILIAPVGSAAALYAETNGLTASTLQHKLSFITSGGASLPVISAVEGQQLSLPDAVRTGYQFSGWFTDSALTSPVVLESEQFTMPGADTVLYASWTLEDEAAAAIGFTYTETEAATILVTGLVQGTSELTIPATLHGLPVTAIAENAFAYETALTRVFLPGSISIVPQNAFIGCNALESVTLEDGITKLNNDCFAECTSLSVIHLPESLEYIGSGALRNTAITQLHLPSSVSLIASDAVNACEQLAAITVEEGNEYYASDDGVLYDLIDDKLVRYPAQRAGDSYTVVDGTCVIGSYAFQNASLGTIHLPESVWSLEEAAFAGCSKLSALPSPMSALLTTIPSKAFAGCRFLKDIIIPDSIVRIEAGAFASCTGLESVTIPAGVTALNGTVFSNPNIIVYGKTGSTAETYAIANQMIFVDPDASALPEGITLSATELQLQRGDSCTLHTAFQPENSATVAVTWYSNDDSIVRVSQDGTLFAIAGGNATIFAVTQNGLSAACQVSVSPAIPVDTIILSDEGISILETTQYQLEYRILPANATDMVLNWTSDDETVCTVDQNGLITAIGHGTATIRAQAESGQSATCTVTVLKRVQSLQLSAAQYEWNIGDTFHLNAEILPLDAADQSLAWHASPEGMMEISADGEITVLRSGYVTLTATATDLGIVTGSIDLLCRGERILSLPADLVCIESEAFRGLPVQEVILPHGTATIQDYAFADCSELFRICIPDTVTFIDDTAFDQSPVTIVCSEGSYAQQWAEQHQLEWRVD